VGDGANKLRYAASRGGRGATRRAGARGGGNARLGASGGGVLSKDGRRDERAEGGGSKGHDVGERWESAEPRMSRAGSGRQNRAPHTGVDVYTIFLIVVEIILNRGAAREAHAYSARRPKPSTRTRAPAARGHPTCWPRREAGGRERCLSARASTASPWSAARCPAPLGFRFSVSAATHARSSLRVTLYSSRVTHTHTAEDRAPFRRPPLAYYY
jgi:hypothetical protein